MNYLSRLVLTIKSQTIHFAALNYSKRDNKPPAPATPLHATPFSGISAVPVFSTSVAGSRKLMG